MFSILNSRLLQRSFLMRLLQTTGLSLALMTASAAGVHAADANDIVTVVGADGTPGVGDPYPNVTAGPGQPAAANAAASSATGNATASASATGGNGGISIGENIDAPGGDASASSTASATGSGYALSTANATGGNFGVGGFNYDGFGGSATATADALATGSGGAFATAVATTGESDYDVSPVPAANASSSAETANGGIAQALSSISSPLELAGTGNATATTSLGGVSVQSNATTQDFFGAGVPVTVEAIAQGGSGQTSVDPSTLYAISTALPDKDYATTLIGGASNVADALLGPGDEIFGTSVLELGSSTFNFSYQGDLLLGIIDDGVALLVTVNGAELSIGNPPDGTVINLGSFGPNIDLTIFGEGTFAFGGAVPEPSTWAMLLAGFAGLGLVGYRQTRGAKSPAA